MAPVAAALWRSLCAHQVYGANTSVGKTVVSTVLCNAIQQLPRKNMAAFLKPVSTGPLDEADDRHIKRFAPRALTRCLYQFDEPVSPHLAAAKHTPPRDEDLLASVYGTLAEWARAGVDYALVETAGGVHSPGPSGRSQADLYRPLRLPIVLVADSRLGGISSSISAYESLVLRGYDVESVLVFRDEYYRNYEYLRDYFVGRKSIPLVSLPAPPDRSAACAPSLVADSSSDAAAVARDEAAMQDYYTRVSGSSELSALLEELRLRNEQRISRLEVMADRATRAIWYPFTQHHGMTPRDITAIDSAYDDYFQTVAAAEGKPTALEQTSGEQTAGLLRPTFDGSASWWTQGLGHGNPELSLSAAYAAGRYGHVMFAGTIHEPALSLAELLLSELGNPRFQKVFFTDNGSTGMEVAVKMGLHATCERYGWSAGSLGDQEIGILGLKGSYHGDTIGVMDCSEPSTYNQKVEWYRGRGFWFDFPVVKMSQGVWKVKMPTISNHLTDASLGPDLEFPSLNSIFDLEQRIGSPTGLRYQKYIWSTIQHLVHHQGKKFGALIMEPVLLGAGGMLFADPLFQHCLVRVVRTHPELFSTSLPTSAELATPNASAWSGLPVIFDEVFTGLYRLGRRTSASYLGVDPDIAVNAKLLTGGLLPLCTTLASKEIFDAFDSPEKSDALLHGHSYTAHAVGCRVAVDSLHTMMRLERDGSWDVYRDDWRATAAEEAAATATGDMSSVENDAEGKTQGRSPTEPAVWSVWSYGLVRDLSLADSVDGVFALGTVLSITLKDETGRAGYTSTAAQGLQQKLAAGTNSFNVHSRVLGNVLYLMASITSRQESLREMEALLRASLSLP